MKYKKGYYVKLNTEKEVEQMFKVKEDKSILKLNPTTNNFIPYSKGSKILRDCSKVSPSEFNFLKERYLFKIRNTEVDLIGDIIKSHFSNLNKPKIETENHFLDSFQYSLGEKIEVTKLKDTKVKPKCKYILFHGDEEVITGYSFLDENSTGEALISCINDNKHLVVHNEEGKITAFYNRVTTGELSFSIETLE